ncbi:MAG: EamA family transporter [Lachnospiraceae bacterium]|nr:EamA family transporter [Lachnospiraceae bacterium]
MKKKINSVILLNIIMLIYSLSSVFSKKAAENDFLSKGFVIFYVLVLFSLSVYAIGWQQVIKYIPLTTAFSNKAVTIVWGMVWGYVLFHERISSGKIIGALLIIAGIIIYALAPDKARKKENK